MPLGLFPKRRAQRTTKRGKIARKFYTQLGRQIRCMLCNIRGCAAIHKTCAKRFFTILKRPPASAVAPIMLIATSRQPEPVSTSLNIKLNFEIQDVK